MIEQYSMWDYFELSEQVAFDSFWQSQMYIESIKRWLFFYFGGLPEIWS